MTDNGLQQLSKGKMLGRRYRIAREIGSGGMAHVYLAQDTRTGRDVAVKVLKPELANDEEFVHRFATEAQAASSLSHPNIVRVLGYGEEDGIRYMIQEYVEGTTLKELIDHYGRLDWRVAVPIVIQVALALENAHTAGIVHRDIKPQNIMITPDRKAMVTDFGIARASTANTITLTSGNAMGSVHYFSPEQARGGMVGPSADIYSLGITMYEMLTGDVPFDGDTSVAVAIKHLQEMPGDPRVHVPDLPAGLAAIVMKCIQKNPRSRYPSARALIDELDGFMIDPDGTYGIVEDDVNAMNPTTAVGTIRPKTDYAKVHALDESIHERRRSKTRETGLLVVLVLLFAGLLVALGVFIMDQVRDTTPTAQTDNSYVVPNFIGMQREEAEARLEADEIRHEFREKPSATVPAGEVFNQQPSPNEIISRSGLQTVILDVSTGSDSLRVGDYVGRSFAEAQLAIQNLNPDYEVIRIPVYHPDYDPDIVIEQDPLPGGLPADGKTITLTVSQGPEARQLPSDILDRNLTKPQAEALIVELGFTVGSTRINPADAALPNEDLYLISVEPAPGSMLPPNTPINMFYASLAYLYPSPTPTPTPAMVSVSGTVFGDTNGNNALDGGESGVPGATVELRDTAGNTISTTSTGGSGDYRFNNIEAPEGGFVVTVVAAPAGYSTGTQAALPSTGGSANLGITPPPTPPPTTETPEPTSEPTPLVPEG